MTPAAPPVMGVAGTASAHTSLADSTPLAVAPPRRNYLLLLAQGAGYGLAGKLASTNVVPARCSGSEYSYQGYRGMLVGGTLCSTLAAAGAVTVERLGLVGSPLVHAIFILLATWPPTRSPWPSRRTS